VGGYDDPVDQLPKRRHHHNKKQNADDATILEQADNKLDELHEQ